MPVKKKATVFDPGYDLEPGMDDAQRDADSKSFKVDPADFFGGRFMPLGARSGPQVGSPYDADAMGQERNMITYETVAGKGKSPKV